MLAKQTLLQVIVGKFQQGVYPTDVCLGFLDAMSVLRIVCHDFSATNVVIHIDLPEYSRTIPLVGSAHAIAFKLMVSGIASDSFVQITMQWINLIM